MKLFQRKKYGNIREITVLGIKFNYVKKIKLPPHINKEKLLPDVVNFQDKGVTLEKRSPRLIVSLTSFPDRMNEIHFTIYSLLKQTEKPDEVVLWLAKEQFPNGEKDIPEIVLKLKGNGLTIKWCDDLRSYKKLIPSLKEFPNDIIIVVDDDDDIYYNNRWLEKLYREYLKTPDCVIGTRGHLVALNKEGYPLPYEQWKKNVILNKPSYRNFMTGCGGVLYPPRVLYKDVDDISLFKKLAPYADDVWFWAMTVLNGIKIRNFAGRKARKLLYVNPERELRLTNELTLAKLNIEQDGNNKQIRQVIEYYPQLIDKLKKS